MHRFGAASAALLAAMLLAGSVSLGAAAGGELGHRKFHTCPGRLPLGKELAVWTVPSRLTCIAECAQQAQCQVALTGSRNGLGVSCRLVTKVTSGSRCEKWIHDGDVTAHVKEDSFCGDFGGRNLYGTCECPKFTYGSRCQYIAEDCWDKKGNFTDQGRWGLIKSPGVSYSFPVYCNFVYGVMGILYRYSHGSWANTAFDRPWNDYKWGFGFDVNRWMGLEFLYQIMKQQCFIMTVQLTLFNGTSISGDFLDVSLGDADSGYLLNAVYAPTVNSTLMSGLEDPPRRFCTLDNDCNDCSKLHKGAGWWYGPNCEATGAMYPMDDLWWPTMEDAHMPYLKMTLELNKC